MRNWFWLAVVGVAAVMAAEQKTVADDANGQLPSKLRRFDRNQDGKLSAQEVPRQIKAEAFPKYDQDGDGALDPRELAIYLRARSGRNGGSHGALKSASGKMKQVRDLRYAQGASYGRNLGAIDLYLPKDKKDFPILFFVHGGGFVKGDKSSLTANAIQFVKQGYGLVAVNYRLSPAVKFPSHVEDVAMAFAWVHRNIGQYGGDRERMFVAGGSAGAYLATLLSLDGRYLRKHQLETSVIRGTIAISGLMNTGPVPRDRQKLIWSRDPKVVREASPLEYVRKDVPAILIMFADGDTAGRKQQNRTMARMLQQVGHQDVTIKELANRTHDNVRAHLADADDPGLKHMLTFMNRLSAK